MGERNVELLEKTVQHLTEDMREAKKKVEKLEENVHDLKTNQQITQHSMTNVIKSVDELKTSFDKLDIKFDESQQEQFQSYKNFMWKVSASIVGSIIVALLIFALNIK